MARKRGCRLRPNYGGFPQNASGFIISRLLYAHPLLLPASAENQEKTSAKHRAIDSSRGVRAKNAAGISNRFNRREVKTDQSQIQKWFKNVGKSGFREILTVYLYRVSEAF